MREITSLRHARGTPDPQFYGKYRGTVVDDTDPLSLGRVQVSVPEVLGGTTAWAMPCAPAGLPLTLPSVGANVWVEFERGHRNAPIWTGCFWTSPEELPRS